MNQEKSEIQLLIQRRLTDSQKPMYLNIIVVGASGLGKSTFIDAILQKKLNTPQLIRPSTTSFQEIKGTLKEDALQLNITFTDTPGYRENYNLKEWYRMIHDYIKNKLRAFSKKEKLIYKSKELFKENVFQDERIHVCLYFFSGPRIMKQDFDILKKLVKIVNVIPILAKGDSFTIDEAKAIKIAFLNEIKEQKIEIYEQEMVEGNFGQSPPYLIISSVEQHENSNGELTFGRYELDTFIFLDRQFAWGFCDIFNPKHSDLPLLYKQLIGLISIDLINMTDFIYQRIKQKNKEKKKKNKSILTKLKSYFK